MRRIEVEGAAARYLVMGSGAPLLLVASPLVSARTYVPVARALSPWFTVVVVELPGSGGSAHVRRAWSVAASARWLIALTRRMPLAAPILVGHAASAPYVVEAARSAQHDFRALVLVDPSGAVGPRSAIVSAAVHLCDLLDEPTFALRAAPQVLKNALRHTHAFLDHARAAATTDLTEPLADLRLPVLLAWGEHDRAAPLESAMRLRARIAGAGLVVARGSHDWLATSPETFAAALRRYSEAQPRLARDPRLSPL